MSRVFSTYEAKSHFSELLRMVRSGQSVVISHRGEPVAELRPIAPVEESFDARIARLRAEGVLVRQPRGSKALQPIARRPGGLKRFLAERD